MYFCSLGSASLALGGQIRAAFPGVDDAEIVAAMNEEEQFPQLVVTEDYKVILADVIWQCKLPRPQGL